MTTAEFIRIRPASDDDNKSVSRRVFVCELPNGEETGPGTWIDCGRVTALASHGRTRRIDVILSDEFASQFEDGHYDPEEVSRVILLWVAWEAKWSPMGRVRIRLSDARQAFECVYLAATEHITCTPVRI